MQMCTVILYEAAEPS